MIRSPLGGWMGGKWQLSRHIVTLIPPHECYAEPFAGAAWVLFRKSPSASEVLNDINREIVTLYRVIQHHLDEFIRYFRWALNSRDEFERQLRVAPDTLTDIQRAARFYYLQKLAFAGRIAAPTLGTSTLRPSRLNLLRIEEEMSAAHLRLSRVMIEHLGYLDLLNRYDRPTTFFYLDPPYWGVEGYYGKGLFSRDDFTALAERLPSLKGRFLLSLNDVPEVRTLFRSFATQSVQCTYSCSRSGKSRVRELLIANYDLPGDPVPISLPAPAPGACIGDTEPVHDPAARHVHE